MTILDGNNLIHKIPHLKELFLKDKESTQLALIEAVRTNFSGREKIIFVFDGFGNIKLEGVIYSKEITADEIIRKEIEQFSDHKKLKVISSDNSIRNLAKVCGCDVQKSEEFWSAVSKRENLYEGRNINQNFIYDKPEKPERISKKELKEFKNYFT